MIKYGGMFCKYRSREYNRISNIRYYLAGVPSLTSAIIDRPNQTFLNRHKTTIQNRPWHINFFLFKLYAWQALVQPKQLILHKPF